MMCVMRDTAPAQLYTLSLHDALPIYRVDFVVVAVAVNESRASVKRHLESHDLPFTFLWDTNGNATRAFQDRKSTRLNSSHMSISYAVFCLKKKKSAKYFSLTLSPDA